MKSSSFVLVLVGLLFSSAVAQPQSSVCPTTLPSPGPGFVPPAPYPAAKSEKVFWYGNETLWTNIPIDGVWRSGNDVEKYGGHADKLIFWHRGFDGRKEYRPNFTFTAHRLDAYAAPIVQSGAIPVFVTDVTPAMMIGTVIPLGCWELTANYNDHVLSFVISVER